MHNALNQVETFFNSTVNPLLNSTVNALIADVSFDILQQSVVSNHIQPVLLLVMDQYNTVATTVVDAYNSVAESLPPLRSFFQAICNPFNTILKYYVFTNSFNLIYCCCPFTVPCCCYVAHLSRRRALANMSSFSI